MEVMSKNDIIERISYFRTRAFYSQKALSVEIGMNVGYINRLECKKDFLPSLEVLLKIIDTCWTTPEEFFYADYLNYRKDSELYRELKKIPEDKRVALFKLLEH